MQSIIKQICDLHLLQVQSIINVTGGDINSAYAIETTTGKLFIKLNSASAYPLMFKREAEGLHALQMATTLIVPAVIANSEIKDHQYLMLEWLEKAPVSTNFWQQFAEGLVQVHKTTQPDFGLSSSNYIGSLKQENNQASTWATFYTTQRIMPLVKKLFDEKSFSKTDVENAETLCKQLPHLFPQEPPSLLHGDLWAGNYMVAKTRDKNSSPAIYDPAVYYGHREMDLGMSLLFGGFDQEFYEAYHAIFPLENNWRKRVPLTQLYPLLVHALLFGGGYVGQCKAILKEWI